MFEVPEADQSAYNSAVQFMFELSGIRKQLHFARWEANAELRYDILISYYLALSSRMVKKLEKLEEKHKKLKKEITEEMGEYLSAKRKNKKYFGCLFSLMDEWERQLRKDENALGLLVPSKDDPGIALGARTE